MHDLAHAGFDGGAHERPRVVDRIAETEPGMRKANPVGVVENVNPAQAFDDHVAIAELKWRDLHVHSLGAGPLWMVGECAHAPAICQQASRDEPAGEAEGAGDGVEVRH